MKYFNKAIMKVGTAAMAVGGGFMIFIMILTVSNVLYRLFFGKVIIGTYELTEFMIIIGAGFSLCYAVIAESNVTVKMIILRMPKKAQAVLQSIISIVGIGTWGAILYASVWFTWRKGFDEGKSELLDIPFLPFKGIWFIALLLVLLCFVRELNKSLSEVMDS
ncbi:MAG: TRAP transporter small permease [Deltaproteobacteria bacterium]|nr:TRAP transporter small permease [Deltaproteobacteria bacterium]